MESTSSEAAHPKVILIIGDGMDQHQITIARNYLVGYEGRLTLDTLPVRSSVQTQTVVRRGPAHARVRAGLREHGDFDGERAS